MGKVRDFAQSFVSLCVPVVPLHATGLNLAHLYGYKLGLRLTFAVSKVSSRTGEAVALQSSYHCSETEM